MFFHFLRLKKEHKSSLKKVSLLRARKASFCKRSKSSVGKVEVVKFHPRYFVPRSVKLNYWKK